MSYTKHRPNPELGRKLDKVAYLVSAVVLVLVIFMRGDYKPDLGVSFSWVPLTNAIINSAVFLCLLSALIFIKRKNTVAHQRSINIAMLLSIAFLLLYVLYHFTTRETPYCGQGMKRTIYFVFLISHIVLAGLSLPFILLTYIRAYTNQYEKHRALAKKVMPVWMYVAITGPIVYWMLAPCYSF